MFLAEALIKLTELKTQLDRLGERMTQNALVEKHTKPQEDIVALMEQYEKVGEEYAILSARITYTNATALVDGKTICALLTERDFLKAKETHMNNVASEGKPTSSYSEYTYRSNIRVKDLREGAERCLTKRKKVEVQIQKANWTVELAELPKAPASASSELST